jgi:hypothetical protein
VANLVEIHYRLIYERLSGGHACSKEIPATLALIILGAPLLFAAFRKEDVQVHKLDNGLKILLLEDHNIPNVALYTYFHVGARGEGALGTIGTIPRGHGLYTIGGSRTTDPTKTLPAIQIAAEQYGRIARMVAKNVPVTIEAECDSPRFLLTTAENPEGEEK